MRPKKQMIANLTLSQNLRLAKEKEGFTFEDIARRAGVSESTSFRMIERTPAFITRQLIRVGKSLGYTERQIREKARQERLAGKVSYGRKSRFYQLLNEIIGVFEEE